jgi:predicted deacylase
VAQGATIEWPQASSRSLHLLGAEVAPATSTRLAWSPNQSFEGIFSATPVLVVNGAEPGPTVCLTAAVHGDELNGIETVRRVMYTLEPERLRGAVIGVPIVNLQGFHRGSRYLGDRRDLNRHFPGDPHGSSASRIAHSFFQEVIRHCNALVDLHTGSFYRTNLPQLRGDLTNPQVVELTRGFGSTVVLHSAPADGTLREAAVAAGIPAVTLEAGAPMVLSDDNVSHSVKGIKSLLHHLDMVGKFSLWGEPEPVYYNSSWQRAPQGGIVFSAVSLGEHVAVGDLLGTVTNPITNVRTEIRSSYDGRVLGMALNQVVQPGFATHHIGIKAAEELISSPEEVALTAGGEREPSSE